MPHQPFLIASRVHGAPRGILFAVVSRFAAVSQGWWLSSESTYGGSLMEVAAEVLQQPFMSIMRYCDFQLGSSLHCALVCDFV